MVRQLTEGATIAGIDAATLAPYYVDHGVAVYPANSAGVPFTAAYLQSKGDPRTDLYENMAAEQKARSTYEYLINMADDPDVIGPLKFLREREIVHFQRFGETKRTRWKRPNRAADKTIATSHCKEKLVAVFVCGLSHLID